MRYEVALGGGQRQQGLDVGVHFVFAHVAADAEVAQPHVPGQDARTGQGPAEEPALLLFKAGGLFLSVSAMWSIPRPCEDFSADVEDGVLAPDGQL